MSKTLAVGHFRNGDFKSTCAKFSHRIKEVFFSWPGVKSCRPQPEPTDELKRSLVSDLLYAKSHGIELDTLFNCNCYGDIAISRELADLVTGTLSEMESFGVFPDTVTTTSPFISKILRERFPQVAIRLSVNQRVHGTIGFEYVLDEFDSFYVSREYHRSFDYLKEIASWAEKHGKKIGMQVNSGCLRQCPYQTFHDNLHGHNAVEQNRRGEEEFDFTYFLCRKTYSKPSFAEDFLRATWIRPEDLPEYEKYVDMAKVATRRHMYPELVVEAYATYSFDGDLSMLMDPVHPFGCSFDNKSFDKRLWDAVRLCRNQNNCIHCSKCSELFNLVSKKKVLREQG